MQRCALILTAVVSLASALQAEEPLRFAPEPIELEAVENGGGWTLWSGVANLEGSVSYRERSTSLHIAPDESVWVGTSHGRILRYADGEWTLVGRLDGVQVTGIAAQDDDIVWLSTGDGMCRLRRPEEEDAGTETDWLCDRFRHYYQGHPGFVSGGYIPGEDAVRLWGHVEGVYMPRHVTTYAPFVVSVEHGLFTWGGYGRVWHHFLPHYWGANSDWLDTRELVPHRRPTCIEEDADRHLWIGTQGDGIVRMNAHARRFHEREPEENDKDGREFSTFGPAELGVDFVRVNDISTGLEGDVWAALVGTDDRRYVARFDGEDWSHVELPQIKRHSIRNGKVVKRWWWEATPLSMAEIEPGRVLVGVENAVWPAGLFELDWKAKEFRTVKAVEHPVRTIARTENGNVWAQTWWGVYRRESTE